MFHLHKWQVAHKQYSLSKALDKRDWRKPYRVVYRCSRCLDTRVKWKSK